MRVRRRAHFLRLLLVGDGVHLGGFEADLSGELEAVEGRFVGHAERYMGR